MGDVRSKWTTNSYTGLSASIGEISQIASGSREAVAAVPKEPTWGEFLQQLDSRMRQHLEQHIEQQGILFERQIGVLEELLASVRSNPIPSEGSALLATIPANPAIPAN